MKTRFVSVWVVLLLCLSAHGQAMRNLNGNMTNATAWTLFVFGNSNLVFTPVSGNGAIMSVNANQIFLIQNDLVTVDGLFTTTSNIIAGVQFIGDGGGLTNLAAATNFSDTVVYNFNGKTTFNSVSYNTNLWAGPTNTLVLATNYQDFVTTTDCNITNVGGQLAGQNTWATLTLSNASASDITARITASGIRLQGLNSTAALVVGAGKEAILSFLSRDFKSTNVVTTAQQ